MGQRGGFDWDDLFAGAALEPHRWMESLDTMARYTGASHGQLIGIGGARDVPFNLVSNSDGWPFDELIETGGYGPDVNFRIAANNNHIARGQYDPIVYERHYDEAMPSLRSRSYVDFCDQIDIPFGCQTNLVVDGLGLIGLATLRTRRDGRTTSAQRRMFADAAAAARRAVRLQERLEGEQAKLIAGAFEAMALTAFIIDARGRLLAHTAAAEERLRAGDVHLREQALDAPGSPYSLGRAIAILIADEGARYVRLRVNVPQDHQALYMEGFRFPEHPWSLGRIPHAILVAREPNRDRAGIVGFLTLLYGLTGAEADIAIRLFEGKTREMIAVERDVAVETIRGQIKSLYAKTSAENEAGLMRLLSAIMA